MNKTLSFIAVSTIGALLSFPVMADRSGPRYQAWEEPERYAQTPTRSRGHDRFDRRVERRIDNGWASGALTRKELRKLERKRHKLAKMERRYREDGRVTRQERRKLRSMRDNLDQAIYRMKHNQRNARHRERQVYHGFDWGPDSGWQLVFDFSDS